MDLRSRSFFVKKGDTLDVVSFFLRKEIGLDAYLIKDLQAVTINDSVTEITVLYKKYDDDILSSIAPREGGIFTTGTVGANFDARLLFSHPIDVNTLTSGAVIADGNSLDVSNYYIDSGSNGYFIKVKLGSYVSEQFHDYRLNSSKIKRYDGSFLPYSFIAGYTIHEQSSAHLGDRPSSLKIRGEVKADLIRIKKSFSSQQAISEFLSNKGLNTQFLLTYTSVASIDGNQEIYIIYVSNPEPQIIQGFPLTHSLFPNVSAPDHVNLVFSTKLDPSQLSTIANLFSIESDFATSTPVSPANITLLSDNRTVRIDTSSYFSGQKIYSIIARPGIRSDLGFVKVKPDQWIIHVNSYTAGSSVTGAAPTDASYIVTQSHSGLSNEKVISVHFGLSGSVIGSDYVLSGLPATTSAPGIVSLSPQWFSSTASGRMSLLETGISHTNLIGVGTGSHTLLDLHMADVVSNPHQVTATQVGAPTVAQFTGHTGYTGVHFTQSEIAISGGQITDLVEYIQDTVGTGTFLFFGSGLSGVYNDATNRLTISGNYATSTRHGVSMYGSAFSVTNGAVAVAFNGITYDNLPGTTGPIFLGNSDSGIEGPPAEISMSVAADRLMPHLASRVTFTGHTGNLALHYTQAEIVLSTGQITNLVEAIQDTIGTSITFGTGVTGSYNDAGNSIVISGQHATTTSVGVSRYDPTQFSVTLGNVVINTNIFTLGNLSDVTDAVPADDGNVFIYSGGISAWSSNSSLKNHLQDATLHFTQGQISIPSSQISDFTEAAQDVIGNIGPTSFLRFGSGVSGTYTDASDFITISGKYASTTVHGVAQYDPVQFTVGTGRVLINPNIFTLNELNDVEITGALDTQVLTYAGDMWTNRDAPGGVGGEGAPVSSTFVTYADSPGLSADRVLSAESGIQLAIGSSNITVSLSGNFYSGITGHTGNALLHFTQSQISITSGQVSDLTEAVQDIVGNPGFITFNSGLTGIYNDTNNTYIIGLSGSFPSWLDKIPRTIFSSGDIYITGSTAFGLVNLFNVSISPGLMNKFGVVEVNAVGEIGNLTGLTLQGRIVLSGTNSAGNFTGCADGVTLPGSIYPRPFIYNYRFCNTGLLTANNVVVSWTIGYGNVTDLTGIGDGYLIQTGGLITSRSGLAINTNNATELYTSMYWNTPNIKAYTRIYNVNAVYYPGMT